MTRLVVFSSALFLLCSIASAQTSVQPSKDAREKHDKAVKIIETRRGDPFKAEKLLKESIALSPEWIQSHRDLADLYSLLKRYDDAANEYSQVVALDEKQKTLSAGDRNAVLDSLGVSQAQARKYDAAIQTYKKAIEQDPKYALFHYNLSCTYAEKGNLDAAIPELRKSWELRDNLPSGTKFPDPRKDSSFKQYLDNPKFQKAVEDIVI